MSLASQGRQLPLSPLGHLEGQGSGTLGGGGFEDGMSHPLLIASFLFLFRAIPLIPSRGRCSKGGSFAHREGSCQANSPLSVLLQLSFRCLEGNRFVETSESLSLLNRFVIRTRFKVETSQFVLRVIWRDDWMISIGLKDAYLQVLVILTAVVFSGV